MSDWLAELVKRNPNADLPAAGVVEAQATGPSVELQMENLFYQFATGKLKAKDVHKQMPPGYKANLRGKNRPVEVLTPSGEYIYIQP